MASTMLSKLGTGGSIFWAILLIVIGVVAIGVPLVAASGVVMYLAWLIVIAGAVQFVHAFQSKGVGNLIWKLLVAVFYLAVGAYLLTNPLLAVAAMTLALAIFFVAEGVSDLVVWIQNRKADGAGWILVDGVVTLVLGVMIWRQWPSSALWVIGALVGINMIMTGVTRLMINLAARRVREAVS